MKCPICKSDNFRVVDTRQSEDCIRRRKECLDCGHRYSTEERIRVRTCVLCGDPIKGRALKYCIFCKRDVEYERRQDYYRRKKERTKAEG